MLTLAQAGLYLGLNVDRVRTLIDKGTIKGTRVGRDRKVSICELRAYRRRNVAFLRKFGVTLNHGRRDAPTARGEGEHLQNRRSIEIARKPGYGYGLSAAWKCSPIRTWGRSCGTWLKRAAC